METLTQSLWRQASGVNTVRPHNEEIAARAHIKSLQRTAPHRGPLDDWLAAERELMQENLAKALASRLQT